MAGIAVERREQRSALHIESPSDLNAFLDREMKFWEWTIKSPAHQYAQINNIVNRYKPNWVNSLQGEATQWETGDENARTRVQNTLNTRFVQEHYLTALDPEAWAVAHLAKTDPIGAIVALGMIHGIVPFTDPGFTQHPANRRGAAKGLTILAGVDPDASRAAASSLDQARDAFEDDANRLRSVITSTKRDAEAAAESVGEDARTLAASLKANYTRSETERQQTFERLKSGLEGVTDAYERHMRLQGPVRYWQKKALRHTHAKWLALSILLIYCVLSVIYLQWAFETAAAHLPTEVGEKIPFAALFKAGAFALLVSSIAFWIGRVLLRIYLSNQHLATDAEERMTMVMTFLALARKKRPSKMKTRISFWHPYFALARME
jgi:hypothetical protein